MYLLDLQDSRVIKYTCTCPVAKKGKTVYAFYKTCWDSSPGSDKRDLKLKRIKVEIKVLDEMKELVLLNISWQFEEVIFKNDMSMNLN